MENSHIRITVGQLAAAAQRLAELDPDAIIHFPPAMDTMPIIRADGSRLGSLDFAGIAEEARASGYVEPPFRWRQDGGQS